MLDRNRLAILSLRTLLAAMFLVGATRAFLFTSYRVSGSSMRETLQDGDRILVCEFPLLVQPPGEGDTVIVEVRDETLVKRVVGTPGDRIAMHAGILVRNGHAVRERIPGRLRSEDSFPEYRLGADEYFVMGDNRRSSVDSRDFGPVSHGQITGRVLVRLGGDGMSTVAALEP